MDLMTVPTNNEDPFVASNGYKVERLSDGQTKITRHTNGAFEAVTWCNPGEYLAIAEHALAARRLPVSGDNAELIAKIDGVVPTWPRGMYGCPQDMYGATVIVPLLKEITAALSASQPREAAPSDPHMGVEHESYCHLQYGLGGKCNCTSHPVRVEVTEAAFSRFVQSFNGDEAGDIDDVAALDGATGWAMRGGNDVRAVFEKAVAALGGGE